MTTKSKSTILILVSLAISWIENADIVFGNDFERLPPIYKPEHDERSYSGIKLANGLKVLLISDRTTEISAAAITVGVGAMNDDKEQPGVANLVSYLLPTASRTYPTKNEFRQYLRERGGSMSNKREGEHKETFSFTVDSHFLKSALHRFARFFSEPLFEGVNSAGVKKTLANEFQEEHDRPMSTDEWRINLLEKSLSEKDHPYSNLAFGTLEMLIKYAGLGDEPQDEKFRNFFQKWYSANLMCLVVLGREKLDKLEEMVVTSFKDVRNNNAEKLVFPYEQHPWKSKQLTHKLYIVPVNEEIRRLRLVFPVPDVLDQYKIMPERYVMGLIEHGGPGTLEYVLRRTDLCKTISAKYSSYSGVAFFSIIFHNLTEEGFKQIHNILKLTFQYIDLLNKEGVQEWIYNENKRLDGVFFFTKENSSQSYVEFLASSMHDYPMEDILSFKFQRGPWNPTPIQKFMSYLRPDNMNVTIISKSFEGIVDQIEPWYGTKHKIEKIPENVIEAWKSLADPLSELRLPPPNEFIADNFNLSPTNANEPHLPYIIRESSISRIWYKQSNKSPTLQIVFEVICTIVRINVAYRSLRDIFVNMLNFSLEEYRFSTEIVGLRWQITPLEYGFEVNLQGFSNKLPILLEKIISRISNFETELNERNFDKAKEKYFSGLEDPEPPAAEAMFYLTKLLSESGWTTDNIIAEKALLQYARMRTFLSKLFSTVFIQGLIFGNCDKQTAIDLVNIIEKPFKSSSYRVLPQQLQLLRTVQMDGGSNLTYRIHAKNTDHNLYYGYFQFDSMSIQHYMTGILFFTILDESCDKILPLTERRDSPTMCGIYKGDTGVHGLFIMIKSKQHPHYLNLRVDKFLRKIKVKLENMSNMEFNKFRMRLTMNKEIQSARSDELFKLYWSEIQNRFYDFHRLEAEKIKMIHLQKRDVLAFFQETIAQSAPKRRKLAIYVFPNAPIPSSSQDTPLNGFTKEFSTLTALITDHSVMQELLPCPLSLRKYYPNLTKSDVYNKDFEDIDSGPDYCKFSKNDELFEWVKLR